MSDSENEYYYSSDDEDDDMNENNGNEGNDYNMEENNDLVCPIKLKYFIFNYLVHYLIINLFIMKRFINILNILLILYVKH